MYKVLDKENFDELDSGRFASTKESARYSNDENQLITQLKTGVSPEEGEKFLTHLEAIELMNTPEWKKSEEL
jgi:hypothetical protein